MALVQELYDTVDLDSAVCGRFLGDGEYYFAMLGPEKHLEFYSINANRPLKVQNVDLSYVTYDIDFAPLNVYYTSGGIDYVLFDNTSDYPFTYFIWKDYKLQVVTEDLLIFWKGVATSPLVPDVLCVYSYEYFTIYGSDQVFGHGRGLRNTIESVSVLNSKTLLIQFYYQEMYLTSIQTGYETKIPTSSKYRGIFPTNKSFETTYVLVESDGIYILDIHSPGNCAKEKTNFETEGEISSCRLFDYDPATGNPIFTLNDNMYFVYTGTDFVRLKTKDKLSFKQVFPYLMSMGTSRGIYTYHIEKGSELQYCKVLSTHNSVLLSQNWMERNLLGSNYYFADGCKLGNLCKSMWFSNSKNLSSSQTEPIDDIFLVGDNLVLAVGNNVADVFDLRGNLVLRRWYRPGKTVYANAKYQVQPTRIYTANGRIRNPLSSNIVFATSHEDKLTIANHTEIAVLNPSLEILETNAEENVVGLFPGGYATSNKIQFLGRPAINLPNITAVGLSNYVLIVENGGPHALYSTYVSWANFVDCKLGLGTINRIDECGIGNLIHTDREIILQKRREFIRLGGVGRKCIFSPYLMTCWDLENGVLSLKTNSGIQSSVRVEPLCPNEKQSSSRICQDQLVWFHEDFEGTSTVVHVKALTERKSEYRVLPKVMGSKYVYFMLWNSFLVEVEYPGLAFLPHMNMTVYNWSDLKELDRTVIPLDYNNVLGGAESLTKEISQQELNDLVHVRFNKGVIFFVPDRGTTSSHFPKDTLLMFYITRNGHIYLLPKSSDGNCEEAQHFPIRNLSHTAGIYPHEYPYISSKHIVLDMRYNRNKRIYQKYTSFDNCNAPMTCSKEIDRCLKFVYTQDPRGEDVYSMIMEDDFDFEFETFDAYDDTVMFRGSIKLPWVSPKKSGSVVCKRKTSEFATTYDPTFLASTGSKVYGITPLPSLEDPEPLREFISDCNPEREIIPTENLIDANALLAALLDEDNHARFRELGLDPIIWRRKLLAMAK